MSLSFKILPNPSTSSLSSIHQHSHSKRPSNRLGHDSDSSDDHLPQPSRREPSIELISDFDSTRVSSFSDAPTGPRAIPPLPDRDFRAVHLARKTKRAKKALYKPETLGGSDKRPDGENDEREGVDRMNSRAIVGGLKTTTPAKRLECPDELAGDELQPHDATASGTGMLTPMEDLRVAEEPATAPLVVESAEQRAVRELLSQANDADGPPEPLDAIPMPLRAGPDEEGSDTSESGDETAQFRRDVARRPDASTLEDYARVPVGQFGLALLKGMGWTEGGSTSRRGRKGLVEAYVPQARPSLLGIGAKPLVLDVDNPSSDGAQSKRMGKNPDRKYVPLLRKVIDQGGATRPRSRSPPSRHSSTSSSHRDRSPSNSHRHRRDSLSSSHHGRREDSRQARHGDERRGHVEHRGHRSRRSEKTDSDDGLVSSRSSRAPKHGEYGDRRRSRSRERRPTDETYHRRR